MSDQHIIFSPERNQWTLADGRHHMELPEWAREIMRDEFERETRPLHDSLDLALDSKRIAERRVTELLDENAKLRELAVLNWERAHSCCGNNCKMKTEGCGYGIDRECNYEREIWDRMRELGVEVDG